jgi:DNA-binding NarL/FixJ family response regulator
MTTVDPRPDTATGRAITVMLVDDHAVVRRGLRAYLHEVPGMQVVQEAADGQAALRSLRALDAERRLPDVVLIDLQMPRLGGVEAIRVIAERYPSVRTVILSGFGEIERVHAALEAGAVGYLLKDARPEEIVTAVRTVAATAGGVCLDPLVARRLTQRLVRPTSGLSALTPRERDILALVATGRSNRQIADSLRISERTARTHVSNVLAKMRLASRTQAALVAIREGLVTVPDAAESGAAPRSVAL